MPSKRDKTTGLPLPTPVTPATNICVQLTIPNAPEYIQAFRGILADLGKFWTWRRTVGQSSDDANEAAELWRSLLRSIAYYDECGVLMSCEDVADCIETSEAVQDAIAAQLSLSGGGATTVYNTSYIGAPMTTGDRNTSVAGAEFCDLDELFGSVTSIVQALDQNNRDFLEIIQLTDNAQQRVSKIIKAIPLLNEVPIDEALDFASQLSTEIKENYEAQYTTALADTYRCALFCIAKEKENCDITFQDLVEYYNDRIGTSLEPINFFGALVQYFISGTWSGTTVVDIMTLIQLSVWQQASNWTGISLRTLQTVGLLGANNPDPDWEILCEDCAETAPITDWFLASSNTGLERPGVVEWLGGNTYRTTTWSGDGDNNIYLFRESITSGLQFYVSDAVVTSGIPPGGGTLNPGVGGVAYYVAWGAGYGPQEVTFQAIPI